MFTKILNSVLKTESSDYVEGAGARCDRKPFETLVTKDSMLSSQQCKLSEKVEYLPSNDD